MNEIVKIMKHKGIFMPDFLSEFDFFMCERLLFAFATALDERLLFAFATALFARLLPAFAFFMCERLLFVSAMALFTRLLPAFATKSGFSMHINIGTSATNAMK
jgi:hypothetical protein